MRNQISHVPNIIIMGY